MTDPKSAEALAKHVKMLWSVTPKDLRNEARDIEMGAPDGRGYAGCLRACADHIENQANEIERLRFQEDMWKQRAKKAERLHTQGADVRTAYARGIEDAVKVVDEYAEHSRNQAEGKILAPVHEAIALRVSKRIRALAPDPEDSVG